MTGQGSFLHSALKGLAAIRGWFSKAHRPPMAKDELSDWLNEQPEIAEEAKQGFEAIDAGRYRKVSRRGNI